MADEKKESEPKEDEGFRIESGEVESAANEDDPMHHIVSDGWSMQKKAPAESERADEPPE